MATDAAIAECARSFGRPTLRVYHWKPFCISLGYHQKVASIDLDRCVKQGIDVVRRPTGGRAVFHAEEITYAVVLPPDWAEAGSVEAVYRTISEGLILGLQKLGVPAEIAKRPLDFHTHYRSALAASCFSAAARYEIVLNEKKLVGSAQRRFVTGILQHGSILSGDAHLALPDFFVNTSDEEKRQMRDEIARKTISIHSVLDRDVPLEEGADALRVGMEEALNVRFSEEVLTDEERSLIEVNKDKYRIK